MSLSTTAVRIKVTLKDVKPEVMRRLVVPVTLRLDRLHLTLQAAFGWTNSHLFEFFAGDVHWGIPDPASVVGSPEEITRAFRDAFITLGRRIDLFLSLPIEKLGALAVKKEVDRIGRE